MSISNRFKKLVQFEKREMDWWFFTLLPLFLILLISIFTYAVIRDIMQTLKLIIPEILTYNVLLSSTDLRLKYKKKSDYQMSPPILLILIVIFILFIFFIIQDLLKNSFWYMIIFFLISFIPTYICIWMYNTNIYSDEIESIKFINQNEKNERQASQKFTSSKTKTKIKEVKWGEDDG